MTSGQNALANGINQIGGTLYAVRSLDGEAYALAHLVSVLELTDAKTRFPELRSRLEELALAAYSSRDRLSTSGLAMAARAHAVLGRAAEARTLLDLLMSRAIPDSPGPSLARRSRLRGRVVRRRRGEHRLRAVRAGHDRPERRSRARRGAVAGATASRHDAALDPRHRAGRDRARRLPRATSGRDQAELHTSRSTGTARACSTARSGRPTSSAAATCASPSGSSSCLGSTALGVTKRGEASSTTPGRAQSMVPSDHAPDPGKRAGQDHARVPARRTHDRSPRGRTQYLSTPFVAGAPISSASRSPGANHARDHEARSTI